MELKNQNGKRLLGQILYKITIVCDVIILYNKKFRGINNMKKIFCLSLCLIIMVQLAACGNEYGYSEYGHYGNFDTVESDFQSIFQLLSDEGNHIYYIKVVNEDVENHEISDSTKIELTDMEKHETLNLKEIDQTHLRNILKNSDGYIKHGLHGFCWVEVQDGIVKFEYDAIGCGVVATSNIKNFISDLEDGSDYHWGYERLSDGWYTYYR